MVENPSQLQSVANLLSGPVEKYDNSLTHKITVSLVYPLTNQISLLHVLLLLLLLLLLFVIVSVHYGEHVHRTSSPCAYSYKDLMVWLATGQSMDVISVGGVCVLPLFLFPLTR